MPRLTTPGPESLLPLTPAMLHILLVLAGGAKHGFRIMKAIDEITQGHMKIGPGTLYGTIKRMLADGLIEESDERPDPDLDDERRRYYRLTPFGQKVLDAEVERLAHLVSLARAQPRLGESS